jgi:uncharacterized FlgJ-related protein
MDQVTIDDYENHFPACRRPRGALATLRAHIQASSAAAMINKLNGYSDAVADDTAFNIDIVDFSRGAA